MLQNSTKSILFVFDKYSEIYIHRSKSRRYIKLNFELLKIKSGLLTLNFFLSLKSYNFFFCCLHPIVNFFFFFHSLLIDEFTQFDLKK